MSGTEIEFHKIGDFTSAFVKLVKVTEVSGGKNGFSALVYQCQMNVDWDGSPTAYGFDNSRDARPAGLVVWDSKQQKFVREREDHFQRDLKPLEYSGFNGSLRNATFPLKDKDDNEIGLFHDHDFEWVGVVSATPKEAKDNKLWIDDRADLRDKFGKFPVIQKDGFGKGYYVSQSGTAAISTAQQQSTPGWKYLQSSYWDAATIPYCVWPSRLGHGVSKGDFGVVIGNMTGRSAGFFFADTGSTTKLGECSGHLVTKVAGSPVNNVAMVTFIVFPRSGGGSAKQGQEAIIERCVRSQISKLSGVPNAEELVTFLSLGADPDSFNKGYGSFNQKGYLPARGTPAATYENIRRALKEWGFHSARKPIDI